RRIALSVPHALWVDDRDRPVRADAQAVHLRAQDAALVVEAQLEEPPLQVVPRGEPALLLRALRLRLVAAEEDVPAGRAGAEPDGGGEGDVFGVGGAHAAERMIDCGRTRADGEAREGRSAGARGPRGKPRGAARGRARACHLRAGARGARAETQGQASGP